MKTTLGSFKWLLFTLLLVPVESQAAEALTLQQALEEIPSVALGLYLEDGTLEPQSARKKRIQLSRSAPEFARIRTEGLEAFESDIQVRRYLTEDNLLIYVFAYAIGDSTDDLLALQKKAGRWLDVSREVFPEISRSFIAKLSKKKITTVNQADFNLEDCASGTYRYELSARQNSIQAVVDSDCVTTDKRIEFFTLLFTGQRFIIQETAQTQP